LTNIVAVAAGSFYSLALRADGTITAWGEDAEGQTDIPTGLTNVVAIASNPNGSSSLALVGDGPPIQHSRLLYPATIGHGFWVTVPSQSGRVYRLEYATVLTPPQWTPLPLVAGNGTNLTLLDPSAGATVPRFYRLCRW
jgi:hypothetical protein